VYPEEHQAEDGKGFKPRGLTKIGIALIIDGLPEDDPGISLLRLRSVIYNKTTITTNPLSKGLYLFAYRNKKRILCQDNFCSYLDV